MLTLHSAGYFILLSIIYLISMMFYDKFEGSFVLKVLPILELMYTVWKQKIHDKWWLLIALMFGGWGDILLDLEPNKLFIGGLASFLVGHLCYIRILLPKFLPGFKYNRQRIPSLVGLILGGIAMAVPIFISLSQKLPELMIPVGGYVTVLLLVGGLATLAPQGGILLLLGGFSFVLSDGILALNKFVMPIPLDKYWIMITYYLAQFGLCYGIIELNSKEPALK